MTRKAVFDILSDEISGRRFLDLFAGTGANGIEALSRGAAHATFVDRSRFCIEAIHLNLKNARLEQNATVIRGEVLSFLKRKRRGECSYDIVFADPPYDDRIAGSKGETQDEKRRVRMTRQQVSVAKRTLQLLSTGNILAGGASVVIEHSAKTNLPHNEGMLAEWKVRPYGSTVISIYKTV
jgi:16S rRNA G966 N2-methylase RsmD